MAASDGMLYPTALAKDYKGFLFAFDPEIRQFAK